MDLLPIPLIDGGKTPAIKDWQHRHRNRLDALFGNLGLATGTVIGLDIDSKSEAQRFFAEHQGIIRCIQETRRGAHFLFRADGRDIRNSQGSTHEGFTWDIRGAGGYVVVAPSVVRDHLYRYADGYELTDPKKLEPFPDRWIPRKEIKESKVIQPDNIRRVRRASAYLSRIRSVTGQGGHAACFRAVCKCRDFGLTQPEAWAVMLEWNRTNAEPPWSDKELLHKLESVYGR